jgi:hypothetical protein
MLQRRYDVREHAKHAELIRAVTSTNVPISERFPPADAAKAHEHMAPGHVLGKTVRISHP